MRIRKYVSPAGVGGLQSRFSAPGNPSAQQEIEHGNVTFIKGT
jgi:hypothetical protein